MEDRYRIDENKKKPHKTKNQGVCELLCPCGNKVQKAILSFKVEVYVTRLLTLVSFERVSLVEYACQI